MIISIDGTDLNRGVYHVNMLEPPPGSPANPVCTCPIADLMVRGCKCGAVKGRARR